MDVLVTGATGFVRAMWRAFSLSDGYRVRSSRAAPAASRRSRVARSRWRGGDILEPDAVAAAVTGCARDLPLAGDYRLWPAIRRRSTATTWRARAPCSRPAPCRGGARRLHSSVGTLGLPREGGPGTRHAREPRRHDRAPTKRSKFLRARGQEYGRPRPARRDRQSSAPFGPWDVKPTPTAIVLDYSRAQVRHAR